MMSNQKQPVLTTQDLRKAGWRWMSSSVTTFNYEGQLSASVVFALSPALRKIYPNDEDYRAALNNHFKYFNTQPWFALIVLGSVLAIEDTEGIEAMDIVQNFKTSVMGPLAGIGDTIFFVMIPTILGSIAGYMALEGNITGAVVWFIVQMVFLLIRSRLMELGYKSGVKVILEMGDKLSYLTEAASIMGLTVVGALIPTIITAKTPLKFIQGDVMVELQSGVLDKIFPALIPVVLVSLIYWLMSKKGMKMTNVIWVIILFSMVCAFFGVLA